MRTRYTALGLAALATAAVSLVAAAPAQADPNVPCWSRSTHIGSNPGYFNLTYKNCNGYTVSVQPYDEFYGYVQTCRTVGSGQWVSWTHLTAPAWHGDWEAKPC